VKLEAARVGGRWLTSKEALERFSVALTPVVAGTTVPVRTPSRRQRENAAAASALERMGIKS